MSLASKSLQSYDVDVDVDVDIGGGAAADGCGGCVCMVPGCCVVGCG